MDSNPYQPPEEKNESPQELPNWVPVGPVQLRTRHWLLRESRPSQWTTVIRIAALFAVLYAIWCYWRVGR